MAAVAVAGDGEAIAIGDPHLDQRYMHLSPAALDAAIRLLETGTDTSRVAVEK